MGNQFRTVWIINHYSAVVSKDGWNGRHHSLASEMRERGWNSVLFVASTDHPSGVQRLPKGPSRRVSKEDGVAVVTLRTPSYLGSGLMRIVNMTTYGIKVMRKSSSEGVPKPDVVIGSTVHPLAAYAGLRLARRHSVPFIFEIRDVWPDALIHLGRLGERSLVARLIRATMRHLLRNSDMVLSPLRHIDRYIAKMKVDADSVLWISNGATGHSESDLHDNDLTSRFTFMYLGSFSEAMDIETIMRAFEIVSIRHPNIPLSLRVIGDGPRREVLEKFASELSCHHQISIENRIPKSQVISRAHESDCLVHALHDHPVYEYGISPNKLFDYLQAGRPIVFATNASDNPVSESSSGFVVPAENYSAMAEAMAEVVEMSPSERKEMGLKGRLCVEADYTFSSLARRLADGLDTVVDRRLIR